MPTVLLKFDTSVKPINLWLILVLFLSILTHDSTILNENVNWINLLFLYLEYVLPNDLSSYIKVVVKLFTDFLSIIFHLSIKKVKKRICLESQEENMPRKSRREHT